MRQETELVEYLRKLSKKYYDNEELTIEERKLVYAGNYRINRVKCLHCNDIITSIHRHDFKYCKCGKIAVDGGSWYLKRSGDLKNYEDMSVEYKDVKEEV